MELKYLSIDLILFRYNMNAIKSCVKYFNPYGNKVLLSVLENRIVSFLFSTKNYQARNTLINIGLVLNFITKRYFIFSFKLVVYFEFGSLEITVNMFYMNLLTLTYTNLLNNLFNHHTFLGKNISFFRFELLKRLFVQIFRQKSNWR